MPLHGGAGKWDNGAMTPPGPTAAPAPRLPPAALAGAALAALLFLPGLGGAGLLDPWEPHYAEVSREMIVREDGVHPWWREAPFFSKPPLLLWGGAAGLAVAPAGAGEWAVRLPVALLGIVAVAVSAAAVERLASRRAGLLAALALPTTPFVALFARQAVPDLPLAGLAAAGTLSFAVAALDGAAAAGWAYAGWVLLGYATLAKGVLGFALPALAFLSWLFVTGDGRAVARLRPVERVGRAWIPLGPLAFLAVAVPWFAVMVAYPGRDESGWTFVERFWLYDHVRRLAAGAHVPTAGGGWLAYLGALAVGTFPWVAAVPGGLGLAVRTRGRPAGPREGLLLLCALWAAAGYVLMGAAATRYPHYVLPMVPPLAILAALFLDALIADGLRRHAASLGAGAVALAATGWALSRRPRLLADLFLYDPRRAYPAEAIDALHRAVAVGPVELSLRPRSVLAALAVAAVLGLAIAALRRSPRLAVGALAGAALGSAAWISFVHWGELAAHWTQRDVFAAWESLRAPGDDPPVAWLLNWRGETFYGENRVREVVDAPRLREVAARPGRLWVVTEDVRLPSLRSALGPDRRLEVAGPTSGRYRLVRIEGGPPSPGRSPP
jgi:4-amino-4-deoxy-L-arabinose transferase-like glycosyltransferase